MKTIIIILMAFQFWLAWGFNSVYSQPSVGGRPPSDSLKKILKPIESIAMQSLNIDSLLHIDSLEQLEGKPYRFGYAFNVEYDLKKLGTCDTLKDGSLLWRLKIISTGALSIHCNFKKYNLSKGSKLFIYDENKIKVLGAYSDKNNKQHKKFAVGPVPGDVLIIELYEPKGSKENNEVIIGHVIHDYKNIFKQLIEMDKKERLLDFGDAAWCEENVNCSTGVDWCREKRSVALFWLDDETRQCSSSLINNTRNDGSPYILTANHCIDGDEDTYMFWFWYFSEGCLNPQTEPQPHASFTGSDIKAQWSTSDFALLELEDGIEPEHDLFFEGWDRTGDTPDWVMCIHHPAVDIMKISYSDESPSLVDNNTHWLVDWNIGTTEGGSSGSPLYNQDRRAIGQDHYGDYPPGVYDPCHEDKKTAFGRFSVSWNGGGTSSTRLKDWLDPDNTGASVLDGIATPNNQWGHIVQDEQTWNQNAYSVLRVGSDETPTPFRVESGGSSTLKAGREIQILPCTQILAGSEFRAYIEELDCDDEVELSDPDRDEELIGCGEYSLLQQRNDFTNIDLNKPNEYQLLHNIPNPFSGTTEIIYSLPQPSPVVVQVYNSIGLPIFELVNSPMQNAGEYKVTFNAANLSDGVYFYTMRTPEFTETKQMILMK